MFPLSEFVSIWSRSGTQISLIGSFLLFPCDLHNGIRAVFFFVHS